MKLIFLDDQQHQYLLHVFTAYCEAILPTSELGIARVTAESVANARELTIEMYLARDTAEVVDYSVSLASRSSTGSVRSRRSCRSFRKAPYRILTAH